MKDMSLFQYERDSDRIENSKQPGCGWNILENTESLF